MTLDDVRKVVDARKEELERLYLDRWISFEQCMFRVEACDNIFDNVELHFGDSKFMLESDLRILLATMIERYLEEKRTYKYFSYKYRCEMQVVEGLELISRFEKNYKYEVET